MGNKIYYSLENEKLYLEKLITIIIVVVILKIYFISYSKRNLYKTFYIIIFEFI